MSLDETQLRELIEAIWSTSVNLEPEFDAPAPAAADGRIAACVTISGAWNGAVVLETDVAGATRFAASMMDMDEKDLAEEDVRDAFGEIVNVLGGNVKAMLPQPCTLSLPSVARGSDTVLEVRGGHQSARTAFGCDGHGVAVTILQAEG